MYYNFIYPNVRVNPDYKFDEVMSGYNSNFGIINNWQYSGATIGGVILSGGSVIANTISATTYYGLPTDIRVTGGTYSSGTATFTNNTGGTFSVTGFTNPFTGGTVTGATTFTNGLTATSISATTYYGLPSTSGLYLPLSGGSVVGNTNITGVFRITGNTTTYGNLTSLGATSSYTATPLAAGPGTYNTFLQKYYIKLHPEGSNNFIPYFINDIGYLTLRGGSVTSNYTGLTQAQIETIFDGTPKYAAFNPSLLGTGMTLNISFGENFNFTNALAISFGATNWRAQDFIVELVSGSTYSTLDVVTGYTESDYLIEFSLPSPNTFDGLRVTFSNFFNTSSPTGFRISDISLISFNSNGPKSLYVGRDGGAVYKPLSVTGATESSPSYSIYNDEDTGMYSPTANTLGFATSGTEKLRIDSTGRIGVGTKSPLFRLHVSGDTKLEGGLTATTLSATTYYGLPTDIRVTGGTYSAGTATFTNNTGGTFSVTGFSTSSYGIIGVSNSSGLYTYYSTFGSAMSAATSGQTIELFSDINESTNTTINLKNGVNINGNNHTYTLITTGTSNCFQDAGVAVNCSISNIIIKRLGGTASSTDTLCLYITGASNIKAYGTKLIGGTTNMRCLTINNASAEVFGIYAEGYNPTITVTNGTLNDSTAKSLNGGGISVGASGKIVKCIGYGVNVGGVVNAGLAIDSFGYDSGVQGFSNNGTAINCTGWSNGSGGFICDVSSTSINCNGYSTANYGFGVNGATNVVSCKGYSTSNVGLSIVNGVLYDCLGFSTASNGIYAINAGATITELRSCKSISTSAAAINMANTTSGSKIYNTEIISKWNNASGHGIILSGNNTQVVQCTIEVTNSSANCLFGLGPLTTKYANNAFAGSLTAVTSNITQGMVNTHDAQGNILI